jgi:hypothetical protein
MARLIKIYDADWQKRKKRPAHLDQTLWWLSPRELGAANLRLWPVWLAAAHCERASRSGTPARRLSVTPLRAEEE